MHELLFASSIVTNLVDAPAFILPSNEPNEVVVTESVLGLHSVIHRFRSKKRPEMKKLTAFASIASAALAMANNTP